MVDHGVLCEQHSGCFEATLAHHCEQVALALSTAHTLSQPALQPYHLLTNQLGRAGRKPSGQAAWLRSKRPLEFICLPLCPADGHFQLGGENKSSFGKTHTETVGAQYKE